MGLFTSPVAEKKKEIDSKPIKRAKIVGVRPSYFNPHAITGDTNRNCVFFDVIFEFQDNTRDIYTFQGKEAIQPYLKYIDLD